MLHALIDPDNNVLRIEDNIDPTVQTKPGYRWLPVIDIPRPSYNPSTHVAVPNVTVGEDAVTRDWSMRAKSPEEIDAEKIQRINAIDFAILAALLGMENRIRSQQSQPVLTMDQYKDLLKELI